MLNVMKEINPRLSTPVEVFEDFLGKRLPKDYQLFLEKTNGGAPLKKYFLFKDSNNDGTIVNALFGITHNSDLSLMRHYREYKNIVAAGMLPIGNDQGGNIILLINDGSNCGSIYFLDHEKPVFLIADSFEEFINGLKSEEEMLSLI